MFATIRAKLLGFGFVSLLFIVLVGGAGYYGYSMLSGVLSDSQGRFDAFNTQLRTELAHDAVRTDVLQILRAARSGDPVAYEAAQMELNEHLDVLDKAASNSSPAAPTENIRPEKIRKAAAAVRADEEAYAKSARSIAALAMTGSGGAEAQFNAFNEQYNTLKSNWKALSNLVAGDMDSSRKAADAASLRARDIVVASLVAALIVVFLFASYLYKGILNPLNQLLKAISKVDAGAYEVRVNLRSQGRTEYRGPGFRQAAR